MARRRELYRLGEVEDGLRTLKIQSVGATLLTDLQQGSLTAVVEFPAFRNAHTPIPKKRWCDVPLKDFTETPRRPLGEEEKDYEFPVGDFTAVERERLARSTTAVLRRDVDRIDSDYRRHFEELGVLGDQQDDGVWEVLTKSCVECWLELSQLDPDKALYPMVFAAEMDRYLDLVKQEQGSASTPKGRGGRPPSSHWPAIYEEAIRRLAKDPTLLNKGKVERLADSLNKWAKRSLHVKGETVPDATTIGAKLRTIIVSKE